MKWWIAVLVLGVALIGCSKPKSNPPEGVESEDLKLDVDMGTEAKPGEIESSGSAKDASQETSTKTSNKPAEAASKEASNQGAGGAAKDAPQGTSKDAPPTSSQQGSGKK